MQVAITIDRERCIGSGQCVHLAPEAFDQDDRALAFLLDPPGRPDDRTLRAITGCPMQAIGVEIGGVAVEPAQLRDWVTGLRSEDPLVELIGSLSESHHELREAMDAVAQGGDVRAAAALAKAHLAEEDAAYATITDLVDPALVTAFLADRAELVRALDALDADVDGLDRLRTKGELAAAIEELIRLEEAVLFPLALAALAGDRSATPAG